MDIITQVPKPGTVDGTAEEEALALERMVLAPKPPDAHTQLPHHHRQMHRQSNQIGPNAQNGGGGNGNGASTNTPRVDFRKPGNPRRPNSFKSLFCCFNASPRSRSPHYRSSGGGETPRVPSGGFTDGYPITQVGGSTGSAGGGPPRPSENGQMPSGANTNNINNNNGDQYSANTNQLSPYVPRPNEKLLLGPLKPKDSNLNCLIIDLDETLVHSSFKPVKNPDFIIPVEIDGTVHQVYVLKRPFLDEFMRRVGPLFECVLFTASLAKYADPVSDLIDKWSCFRYRLFREACTLHKGNYVKDLTRLGRDLKRVIIIDNSPASYQFHPDNAIPVQSWFDDLHDTELYDLIPALEQLSQTQNVFPILTNSNERTQSNGSDLDYPDR